MSKIKFKDSFASLNIDKFGGIDRTRAVGDAKSARDIRNFRILADGSLEKRKGYRCIMSDLENIRAVWSGMLEGYEEMILLIESSVYMMNYDTGDIDYIGEVLSYGGEASFFMLEGRLYLKDNRGIYRCDRHSVTRSNGYVPLYGLNWPNNGGEVYEPINQLSDYVRIRYLMNANSVYLPLKLNVLELVQVKINGTIASNASIIGTNISLYNSQPAGTVVDVCMRIGSSYSSREMLNSCTGTAVYGGNYDTCVYCFSGEDKARVFRSRYVRKEDILLSQSVVPSSDGVYFPLGYDYYVASGGAVVSAVCRHYDRLLIFGLDEARMTELSSEVYQDTPAMPINTGVGCLHSGGVALCDNDPVTLSRDGIYIWTSKTDARDESSARRISDPLGDLMSASYREGAFLFNHRAAGELWIGNPGDSGGRVFIYNYRFEKWYCFTGIRAERFFVWKGKTGFCRGGEICFFDSSGLDEGGVIVRASYESAYGDLGMPERDKRLKRCMVVSEGEGNFVLSLRDPAGEICSLDFCGDAPTGVGRRERRFSGRRASHLLYRIESDGVGDLRIFALALTGTK